MAKLSAEQLHYNTLFATAGATGSRLSLKGCPIDEPNEIQYIRELSGHKERLVYFEDLEIEKSEGEYSSSFLKNEEKLMEENYSVLRVQMSIS